MTPLPRLILIIERKELREIYDQPKSQIDAMFKCTKNEPNYHTIDNKCYYIDTTSRNYDDAKQNCNTKFTLGKLFEPKSSTSSKRVHKVALGIKSASFWLGINDKRNEGSWVYDSDGTSVAFSIPWYPEEPNGGSSQNCLVYWNPSQIGQLSDLECTNSYLSICELIV